uniref:Uncharacterized protein n=1 Tax=Arundo donax TaxID=35708 RepID=A0A0A9CSB9_ARUDO
MSIPRGIPNGTENEWWLLLSRDDLRLADLFIDCLPERDPESPFRSDLSCRFASCSRISWL